MSGKYREGEGEGEGDGDRYGRWRIEGVGTVLVYGAEEEDFRFGRHWWRVRDLAVEGQGKEGLESWKANCANKGRRTSERKIVGAIGRIKEIRDTQVG